MYYSSEEISEVSGDTVTYTYDPLGRMASQTHSGTTTKYLYDGVEPIADSDGGGDGGGSQGNDSVKNQCIDGSNAKDIAKEVFKHAQIGINVAREPFFGKNGSEQTQIIYRENGQLGSTLWYSNGQYDSVGPFTALSGVPVGVSIEGIVHTHQNAGGGRNGQDRGFSSDDIILGGAILSGRFSGSPVGSNIRAIFVVSSLGDVTEMVRVGSKNVTKKLGNFKTCGK